MEIELESVTVHGETLRGAITIRLVKTGKYNVVVELKRDDEVKRYVLSLREAYDLLAKTPLARFLPKRKRWLP
jgi:hypothetical protein